MARPKVGKLVRQRTYCLGELAKDDLGQARRNVLETKLAHLNDRLAGMHACRHCGRPLTDPVSIERGVGPECAAQMKEAVGCAR